MKAAGRRRRFRTAVAGTAIGPSPRSSATSGTRTEAPTSAMSAGTTVVWSFRSRSIPACPTTSGSRSTWITRVVGATAWAAVWMQGVTGRPQPRSRMRRTPWSRTRVPVARRANARELGMADPMSGATRRMAEPVSRSDGWLSLPPANRSNTQASEATSIPGGIGSSQATSIRGGIGSSEITGPRSGTAPRSVPGRGAVPWHGAGCPRGCLGGAGRGPRGGRTGHPCR